MKTSLLATGLVLAGLVSSRAGAAETTAPDPEGYIRDWLMLAPIPLPEGVSAGDLLLVEQIPGEASLKPKAGDRVTANGRPLAWTSITTPTNHFDFNAVLQSQNDRSAGFMVSYIECDREIPDVILAVGSNDQGRLYFNGVDIYAFTEARPLQLDADKGRVTLKSGVNVFVFKVLNEQNSWQGALRLLDKTGAPLQGIRIRQTP